MACTLSLKSFEENAGMAAPGWALAGKNAPPGLQILVGCEPKMCSSKVLAELRRDETLGCDLEDDRNLNTFAVGCDVRQRRC